MMRPEVGTLLRRGQYVVVGQLPKGVVILDGTSPLDEPAPLLYLEEDHPLLQERNDARQLTMDDLFDTVPDTTQDLTKETV